MSVPSRKYFLVIAVVILFAIFQMNPDLSPSNPSSADDDRNAVEVLPAIGMFMDEPLRTIIVTVSMSNSEYDQLVAASNRFMMKYPHITVVMNNIQSAEAAFKSWEEDAQIGAASDILLTNSGFVGELAVKGYLKPVDSLSSPGPLSDQPSRLLDSLKWNGYLWGVPSDADPYLLVWNKGLLASVGATKPPVTWSDYLSIAEKLTAENEAVKAVQFTPGEVDQLIGWLDVWTSPDQVKAAYLTPASVQHWKDRLQFLGTLQEPISTDNVTLRASLAEELDQKKKLLTTVIPWSAYQELSEAEQSRILLDKSKLAPMWFNSRSYVVSSTTAAAEEAFLWIKEMTSQHEQQQASLVSRRLPAKNSLYENSGLTNNASASPPQWWLPLLNNEPIDESPDPAWQGRRQRWEELWRQYTAGAIDLEMLIQSLESVQ